MTPGAGVKMGSGLTGKLGRARAGASCVVWRGAWCMGLVRLDFGDGGGGW